jgi:hypothetical protein
LKFYKTLRREFEVAFSRNAQPIWLRILKYAVIASFIYFYWRSRSFWIILTGVFILGLLLHFWYRYKTQGWTKSYGGWDFEKNKSKLNF